jgi:hypothetical protein
MARPSLLVTAGRQPPGSRSHLLVMDAPEHALAVKPLYQQ